MVSISVWNSGLLVLLLLVGIAFSLADHDGKDTQTTCEGQDLQAQGDVGGSCSIPPTEPGESPPPILDSQRLRLKQLMDMTFQNSVDTLAHDDSTLLHSSRDALGPLYARCVSMDGEVLYEKEHGIKAKQAVSIRSLSKIVTASAALALHDRGLVDLNEPVGKYICEGTPIANETLTRLLSMSARAMDWRLNAARIAQQARRKVPYDFVGFPPLCDELGYSPLQCARDFICPFYRGDPKALEAAGVTQSEIENAPNDSCGPADEQQRKFCLQQQAQKRLNTNNPSFMMDYCRFLYPGSGCPHTLAIGEHKPDPNLRWQYSYDAAKGMIVKKETEFVYDNYGFTVADAYVFLKTGKTLLEAAKEFVFTPLGMKGSLKCLEPVVADDQVQQASSDGYECLNPPQDLNEWFASEFAPWTKGEMSPSWVSNTFFASGEDFSRFLVALLRNGTILGGGDNRFLSKEAVNRIFTPQITPQRPLGSCVGTQAFGMGIGYCEAREAVVSFSNQYVSKLSRHHRSQPGRSMCTSERTWSWGASHGSRISLLRDKGVGCLVMLNTPNILEYNSRAHFIGHNMSSILRDVFGR